MDSTNVAFAGAKSGGRSHQLRHDVTSAPTCVGVIRRAAEGAWIVGTGTVVVLARRAASCLLEPVPGDTVACVVVAPNELWITTILQRESDAPDILSTGRALRVSAPALSLSSIHLEVQAESAEMGIDAASVVGREFTLVAQAIKLIGNRLSSVFDRVVQFSKHYRRSTEGIDHVTATYLERDATQLMRMSGETTLVEGHTLVKARGGQIHFG
jgi:hypothetical protein